MEQDKIINFRQAIELFIYILILMIILLLGILFVIILAKSENKDFDLIAKDSSFVISTLSKNFYIGTFDNQVEEENIFFEETNDVVTNVIDVKLEHIKDKKYSLPKRYEVEYLENGKVLVGNVRITNYSGYSLEKEKLEKVYDVQNFDSSDFLIFHTHATECYSDSLENNSNYRTTNEKYNVVSIGEFLATELNVKGFEVVQDKTMHDYPNYNVSYQESLSTVKKHLKEHKYDFVFDIHRDAISSDLTYAPTISLSGEEYAQLMFVIGTDACGLSHDKWIENLRLAITIQNRANEMYPGLFRDLNLSSSRYNQHVSEGAFIIEVGTTGNTLEQAKKSMMLLANILDSF